MVTVSYYITTGCIASNIILGQASVKYSTAAALSGGHYSRKAIGSCPEIGEMWKVTDLLAPVSNFARWRKDNTMGVWGEMSGPIGCRATQLTIFGG
jgi:hypothetical protein